MKQCPVCKSTYTDDTLRFCLNDGAALFAPSISSSSEVTQRMSFDAAPTVENNPPIRVHIQPETPPTQFVVPRNTAQTEHPQDGGGSSGKGFSPAATATIIALLAIIAVGGIAFAYFAFVKPDDDSPTAKFSPSPTKTTASPQTNSGDDTQALKDKVEKLEKQINDQKNSAKNPTVPTISTPTPTPPPPAETQTGTTARVNSPGDGFLALRTAPSVQNGDQIMQIPHGARVSVLGCQGYSAVGKSRGRWCRVNYAGQSGWAFDAFLIY